jgi:antitoxin (DNA-binding transcriptional repressor) of toxin-antitoxin stability system
MANLKTVGIKELKNNLSAYLREVRMGARILVSDRNVIIAELHEPLSERTLSPNFEPKHQSTIIRVGQRGHSQAPLQ